MHVRSTVSKGDVMEPLIALVVAGGLAVYLVVTLLRPERF
ncbi:K(+)-transporting ATPase subunit F [Agrobacterium vaccinii]|jgi:K+-transporting ATPase KdpF subunit|nr:MULTISPECIES: K(+)-transporting ATPase subunit F [Agrobacterium]UHS59274.1 K(+)-transporting ATPase subunit F [Agrobacterium vaccinii]UHS63389.1 K(+)-transporting ATPase subunit F [Agrobacterium vaccinii]